MTQTTSQAEAAVERVMEAVETYALGMAICTPYGIDENEEAVRAALRAALASQQEVAATVTDAELLPLLEYHLGLRSRRDDTVINDAGRFTDVQRYRDFAAGILAASRAPVASPAEPVAAPWMGEEWLKTAMWKAAEYSLQCEAYALRSRGTQDEYPEEITLQTVTTAREKLHAHLKLATHDGGVGMMDARPDSFHSDSGECDRVQGRGPTNAQKGGV